MSSTLNGTRGLTGTRGPESDDHDEFEVPRNDGPPVHGYQRVRQAVNNAFNGVGNWITSSIRDFILEIGAVSTFGFQCIRLFFARPMRFSEMISHLEFVGNKSISIICLSGFFTGLALAYQIYLGFKMVNTTMLVGPVVGLGITRELGPVLTGLIVSARAGGAMAARLGTMRVSEQIDAIEVMGIDPRQYLVSPRIIAAVIAMPLLTAVFDFVAMFGCWLISVYMLNIDNAAYWNRIQAWIRPNHIYEGLFKAAVFGLFFGVICTYRGYKTKGGASGVGQATNSGVVQSMVLVIIMDFFATNIINAFYRWKEVLFG